MRPVVIISLDSDLAELEGLVDSLGHEVQARFVQPRRAPDPATWLGSGKVEELRRHIADQPPFASGADWLVVANGELKPSQVFNLEEALGVEVWDRIRLILEIFQSKASVREAQLQVELARLRYELPFLHESVHRQRKGEHPGYMSGGEYDVRTYETQIRKRSRRISNELYRIRQERRQRRTGRRDTGFRLVAITGYTNAGKSQLLNALCDADAVVDPKYFSTLETRTRRIKKEFGPITAPTLLTDTVGFIRGLPPWLVDAFASTLEESTEADVVVLVVDLTDSIDLILEKMQTALEILRRLGASDRLLLFFNKQDKLSQEQHYTKLHQLQLQPLLSRYAYVIGSGKSGVGLQELVGAFRKVGGRTHQYDLIIDITEPAHASLLSWVQEHLRILQRSRNGTVHLYRIECGEAQTTALFRRAKKAGAKILTPLST